MFAGVRAPTGLLSEPLGDDAHLPFVMLTRPCPLFQVPVALACSAPETRVKAALRDTELAGSFDAVITAEGTCTGDGLTLRATSWQHNSSGGHLCAAWSSATPIRWLWG